VPETRSLNSSGPPHVQPGQPAEQQAGSRQPQARARRSLSTPWCAGGRGRAAGARGPRRARVRAGDVAHPALQRPARALAAQGAARAPPCPRGPAATAIRLGTAARSGGRPAPAGPRPPPSGRRITPYARPPPARTRARRAGAPARRGAAVGRAGAGGGRGRAQRGAAAPAWPGARGGRVLDRGLLPRRGRGRPRPHLARPPAVLGPPGALLCPRSHEAPVPRVSMFVLGHGVP